MRATKLIPIDLGLSLIVGCDETGSTVYENGNGTVTNVTRSTNPFTNTTTIATARYPNSAAYQDAHQQDALAHLAVGLLKAAVGYRGG